jgi:hypothetical protein
MILKWVEWSMDHGPWTNDYPEKSELSAYFS